MTVTINQNIVFSFAQTGVQAVSGSLQGLTGVIGKVVSMINPLNAAIGAIGSGAALAGIAQVGSQYEDLRIQMAQTLRMMGRGGTDFGQSLQNADATIQKIYTAAAALPGEAEDYAVAFRMAGANVDRAVGGMGEATFAAARSASNIEQSASRSAAQYQMTFNLVRDMTAIGVSMGRNSAETAMVLSNAVNTQRGMLEMGSDYTRDLVNAMRSIPQYANLTVQSFNAMKLEDRVRVMQQLAGQYKDMIEASSGTWAAVSGSFATMSRQLVRLSTADLFGAMVRGVQKVNEAFVDSEGRLTEFGVLTTKIGSIIGSTIGKAIEWLAESFLALSKTTRGWLASLADSPIIAGLDKIAGAVGALSTNAKMGAAGGAVAAGALGSAALTGPAGMAIAAFAVGMGEFLNNTEAVNSVLTSLKTVIDPLIAIVVSVVGLFGSVAGLLGAVVTGALPGIVEGLSAFYAAMLSVYTIIIDFTSAVIEKLTPGFRSLAVGVGAVVRGLGHVLAPIIRLVGGVLLVLFDIIVKYVAPVFNFLIDIIGQVIEGLGLFLDWIGSLLGQAVDAIMPAGGDESPATSAMRDMLNSLTASLEGTADAADASAESSEAAASAVAARPTPGGRGGGGVHQDFRNSRFEIQQKFEEGFDPDRVAVAFANDLGRVGERRLSSGFEPLFGVR